MRTPYITLLVMITILLAACTPPVSPTQPPASAPALTLPAAAPSLTATPASNPISVTDAAGRTITLPRLPQRITIAGRAIFLVSHAAYLFPEAITRLVAIGETSQGSIEFLPVVDPKLKEKQRLKVDVGPEQVAATNPDLVIIKISQLERLGKPLEALGLKVVALDLESPEAFARDIKTLGVLFGNEKRAAEITAYYQARLDRVKSIVDQLPEDKRPRVLLMQYADRDGAVTLSVPPMAWIQTVMTTLAGGRPAWKDAAAGSGWNKVGFEQIAAWDVDQIFIISYFTPVNEVVKKLKADPQWQSLRAVKENRLYGFATDFYSWDQADTRWILGMLWLAGKINPEAAKGLDILTETRDFYQRMYGIDSATFDQAIKPLLTGDLP